MDDKEFENLRRTIQQKMVELAKFQKQHRKITGKHFVISGPLPEPENAEYEYAKSLAIHLWRARFESSPPDWKPLDDLMGVLTQIDNMIADIGAKPRAKSGIFHIEYIDAETVRLTKSDLYEQEANHG